MNWLKNTWGAISAALLFALAVFAAMSAQSHKNEAKKWKDKAVDIEEGNVSRGTLTAKAANAQAKLHDVRAKERKKKTKARITKIGENNAPIADVLNSWRK